jgi:copper chaperone CopZ
MLKSSFVCGSLLLACVVALSGCASSANAPEYEEKPITHNVTQADIDRAASKEPLTGKAAVMYVNGLGCPLCASNIDRQLKRVRGVTSIEVDLSVGRVTVGLLPGKQPSPYRLGEAVEDAGFTLVRIEEVSVTPL